MNEKIEQKNNIQKKPSRKRYIIAAGFILLLIISVMVFSLFQTEPKPDPASEKIIQAVAALQLRKDPNEITEEDFATITELRIVNTELSDIRILKKFMNLQKLHLLSIRFPEDKIPLWMSLLGKIGLISKMKVELLNFEILEKLPELHTLFLSGTQIRNIKFIKGLKNLQRLSFSGTQVSDLKPLRALTKLDLLDLSDTQISNLEHLKALKNLQSLHMQDCPNITDQQIEDLQRVLPNLKIYR